MVDVEPERPGPREGPWGPKRGFGPQHLIIFPVILTEPAGLGGWFVHGSTGTLGSAPGCVHDGSTTWGSCLGIAVGRVSQRGDRGWLKSWIPM